MAKDLHAFPGGSSRGTYNGIYPLSPIFWQLKSRLGNLSGPEIGHLIYGKALEWPPGLPFLHFLGILYIVYCVYTYSK